MTHLGPYSVRASGRERAGAQDESRARTTGTPLVIFTVVAAIMLVDIAGDVSSGAHPHHTVIEGTGMILMLVGLRFLLRQWTRERRDRQEAIRALEASRTQLRETSAASERWREQAQELLSGLGTAIDEQFARWGLTDAERDIALLQLKGLTHKEIADIRATSERTVRHHALSIYRKSGLGGRVELAAFFLEDLLLPAQERASASPAGGMAAESHSAPPST